MNRYYLALLVVLSGCGVSSQYVRSAAGKYPATNPDNVRVFYETKQVPWEYDEIGRIFLKTTELTSENQARDINAIKREAAKQGAEGVIIQARSRYQASGMVVGGMGGSQASTSAEYFGIAIVKSTNDQ